MTDKNSNSLQQEWISLHNNNEKSEVMALVIKLLALILFVVALIARLEPLMVTFLLLVLWLQEAIWKTFQSRAEQRLIAIEKAWVNNDGNVALQFYSQWQEARPGFSGLIKQYISNAIRPTVAYPYILLIPVIFITG